MNKSQTFAAILATVILGAVGSGLWDLIFKPALPWLGELALGLGTLGIESLRDSIYVEIAKGTYERAGLFLSLLFLGILGGLTGGAATIMLFKSASSEKKETVDSRSSGNLVPIIAAFVALVSGYSIISGVRLTYITRAAVNIEQFQRVVAPILSENDRVRLASRVAQIASKNDYEILINELNTLAQKNGLRGPEFNIY